MLALIAGAGRLPELIAEQCKAQGQDLLICAFEGAPTGASPDIRFRLENLIPFLQDLKARGVSRVCFAGVVRRPAFSPEQADPETASRFGVIAAAMKSGDDATLRFFADLFQEFGMAVVGAHDIMPELLDVSGVSANASPTGADLQDAERGKLILDLLGRADVGQSCVVAGGIVLGIETIQGTDALLDMVAASRAQFAPGRGGVLIKRAKPGQDRRFDLPTIGPGTIAGAVKSGLTSICLEPGAVMIIDRKKVMEQAGAAGILLWNLA